MSNDTKSVIREILKIEGEQRLRYRKNTLARYNQGEKVHLKQMEFHRNRCKNRWAFGGNRSGKTECGAVETVWRARGIHPFRENEGDTSGWVVSVSFEVQREVAQAKILYYLNPDWIVRVVMHDGSKDAPESGIIDTIYVQNVFGGVSKIAFKSADQGREKFQGASLDYVWFDEEPPQDVYEECRMRVMDRQGELYGTMTPLKGQTWVYDEIYLSKSPDIFSMTMEWADNPFLPKEEVERMTAELSKEQLLQRRYGRFLGNAGAVYPEFDPEIHVAVPRTLPEEWQSAISIDPGLNNPFSCHFYYRDPAGKVYAAAEHYEQGRDVDYHAEKIWKIAKALNWRTRGGYLEAYIDSAANQHTLNGVKSVAELFAERKILVNPRVNKELFSGIATVKHYLSARPPMLEIFACCPNLIRELKGYRWGQGDVPVKRDDHALDELRYYLMSHPDLPQKQKEELPRHLKHREALLRRVAWKNRNI